MKYGAVIVENRNINVSEIIERHNKFLPKDWEVLHISDVPIKNAMDYNLLLTSPEFWESLPFDKVLIFQHDSGLLREGIEEFLQWDYIGAPWKFSPYVGNGGLSLRTKEIMLKVIAYEPYSVFQHGNEDVYFANRINKVGGRIAPICEAKKFAVETMFELGTLGYHAPNKYLTIGQYNEILNQYK